MRMPYAMCTWIAKQNQKTKKTRPPRPPTVVPHTTPTQHTAPPHLVRKSGGGGGDKPERGPIQPNSPATATTPARQRDYARDHADGGRARGATPPCTDAPCAWRAGRWRRWWAPMADADTADGRRAARSRALRLGKRGAPLPRASSGRSTRSALGKPALWPRGGRPPLLHHVGARSPRRPFQTEGRTRRASLASSALRSSRRQTRSPPCAAAPTQPALPPRRTEPARGSVRGQLSSPSARPRASHARKRKTASPK